MLVCGSTTLLPSGEDFNRWYEASMRWKWACRRPPPIGHLNLIVVLVTELSLESIISRRR
eukprot:730087-Amphidinium_carterae.1